MAQNEDLVDGAVLGAIRKPSAGWGPEGATRLNNLVRQLAVAHDWRHFVVRMHPSTWRQVMPYLDYNLSYPKPGIPMEMDRGIFEHADRIEVAYRDEVLHPY